MSKDITPMKRLSTQLDTLKSTIAPYFRSYSLNKSSGHYNPTTWERSKGVESDFLLIFKSLKSDASFAFRFNYMGLSKDEQTIETSIKRDEDDILSVPALSLEEFKERLNLFVKTLEQTPRLLEKHVWDTLSATFDIHPKDINKVVAQAQTDYTENVKSRKQKLNIPALETRAKLANEQLNQALDLVQKELMASEEQQLVSELEAKLKRAKILFDTKKKNLHTTHKIPSLTLASNQAQKAVDGAKRDLDDFEREQRNRLPKHISKRLKY